MATFPSWVMEVTEPANLHIETQSDNSLIRILLSDEWAELFQDIKSKLFETGLISIELDIFENVAERFIGNLFLDLGPVTLRLGLLALAIYEACNRLAVTGYEIARTPAKTGKSMTGKTRHGKGGYMIEPVVLD